MLETNHNSDDRDVTNCLIDISELSKYSLERTAKFQSVSQSDLNECVSGWKRSETVSRSSKQGNAKKKRGIDRSISDLHYGTAYSVQSQSDDYWSNSSSVNEHTPVVRCIGDEFETYPIPPWKSNIEQGTCRYIHDNGSYRTLKFLYDDRKDWYTIRKKRPEKVSTTWHHTCKRMQREMKRQLKKDMAIADREREKNSSSKSGQNSARSVTENINGDDNVIYNSKLLAEELKQGQLSPQKLDISFNNETLIIEQKVLDLASKPMSLEYHGKPLHKKETRVKSTHSDGAVSQISKMKTIHESEPVTPMPHYSIPSGNQMLKSASDLFIENFSTRISALEDEIKKDSKWLRKNENELTKMQSNRAKYRDVTRPSFKDSSASITPRGPLRTEALTSDIFSVKPMVSKETKPLEKIKTNINKMNSQNGDSILQNEVKNNFPNKNSNNAQANTLNGVNINIERGVTGYQTFVDNTKQALLNTLTGTKINTQNNKKSSKGFSAPSTITLCDNSSTSVNITHNFSEQQSDALRQIPIIVDKKSEKKGSLQNIPAFLPEISGKRLEPTSTTSALPSPRPARAEGDIQDTESNDIYDSQESQTLAKKVRFKAQSDELKVLFSEQSLLKKRRKSFSADMKIFSYTFQNRETRTGKNLTEVNI